MVGSRWQAGFRIRLESAYLTSKPVHTHTHKYTRTQTHIHARLSGHKSGLNGPGQQVALESPSWDRSFPTPASVACPNQGQPDGRGNPARLSRKVRWRDVLVRLLRPSHAESRPLLPPQPHSHSQRPQPLPSPGVPACSCQSTRYSRAGLGLPASISSAGHRADTYYVLSKR